jgi:hypothetical protein
MTTISVFQKLIFGPEEGKDHIVRTSLEAPAFEDLGDKYLPDRPAEREDEATRAEGHPTHHARHPHRQPPVHAHLAHEKHSEHAHRTQSHRDRYTTLGPDDYRLTSTHATHAQGHRQQAKRDDPYTTLGPNDYRLTDRAPGEAGHDWRAHMDRRGIIPHQTVQRALVRRGFSPEDAAAITGNLIYESGGNQLPGHPVVLNPPTGGHSGSGAWGAAQWEGGRKAGVSPSLESQVEHIWDEMHGSGDPGAAASYKAMQRAKTVAEKAHIVNAMYERPQPPRATAGSSSDRGRIRLAEEVYRGRGETPAVAHASRKRLLGAATPSALKPHAEIAPRIYASTGPLPHMPAKPAAPEKPRPEDQLFPMPGETIEQYRQRQDRILNRRIPRPGWGYPPGREHDDV